MSVADELRREKLRKEEGLTSKERIDLAFELGRRDLMLFMETSGLSEVDARFELRRRRQAGRNPSRCAGP